MKKIIFVAILGLIAATSNAQVTTKIEKDVLNFDIGKIQFEKDMYEKQAAEIKSQIEKGVDEFINSPSARLGVVNITVTFCGQTGTFTFNTNQFSAGEIIQIIHSVYQQYCGTGPCA